MTQRAVLALVLALLSAQRAAAQVDAFSGWDDLGDAGETFRFDPDETDVATFYVKESAEVRFRFDTALRHMEAGRFVEAAEPLQEIVNLFPDHLYRVADRRSVGAAEYATFLLASFPPEGRRAYADWADVRVRAKFERARRTRDVGALSELANRWPLTRQGQQALTILGDLAWERGAADLAARYHARRAALEGVGGPIAADTAFRLAASLALRGDAERARRIVEPLARMQATVAGGAQPLEEALARVPPIAAAATDGWPVFGGNNAHDGLVTARPTAFNFTKETQSRTFSRPDLNPFELVRPGNAPEFPMFPAVTDDRIVVTDGIVISGRSLLSAGDGWTYEGPLFDAYGPGVETLRDYVKGTNGIPSIALSLTLMPTIAGDRAIAALVDEKPDGPHIQFDNHDITAPIPERSLTCVDVRTGGLLWRQRRPELGPTAFVNRLSVAAPPLVVSDRVLAAGYVLEGAINYYVACFSLHDGSLLWQTPIVVGQQELTMFNKSFKEFTLQMPAERDGTLYVSTNLGLIAAVEVLSGNVRWVTEYDSIEILGSQHYSRPEVRPTYWGNDPPVVSDGVAVFTPLDSDWLYAVDASTGKVLWSMRHDVRPPGFSFQHVLGADDGVLVLQGEGGLGFHDLHSGRALDSGFAFPTRQPQNRRTAAPMGRGCLSPGAVHVPLEDRLLVVRWNRRGAGIEYGAPEQVVWGEGGAEIPGNLLLYRDFVITASPVWLNVLFDVQDLTARVLARVRSAGGAAALEDLLLLGDLERLRDDPRASIDAFQRALESPDLTVVQRAKVHDGLYEGHMKLAVREAEAAGADRAAGGDAREREIAHLAAAMEFAATDLKFLHAAEQLLAIQRARADRPAYVAVLDRIDARCPDQEFPFTDQRFGGRVKAGIFTLDRRAQIAFEEGRPAEAVESWQRLIDEYKGTIVDGRPIDDYARESIDGAIAIFGPEVYAAFEARAASEHARALADRDPARLARLIETLPNAAEVPRYRLDLTALLLERGRPGDVFGAAMPLLALAPDSSLRAHAFMLIARAAERIDALPLARALWSRLAVEGRDVPILGGEGNDYAGLARAEAERLGAPDVAPTGERRIEAVPSLDARTLDLQLESPRGHLVEVGGDGFPDDELLALVFQPGSLRLVDVDRNAERWQIEAGSYHTLPDPVAAWMVGGRLVVRQRDRVTGIAPADGSVLFETTLPENPLFLAQGSGLLYAMVQRLDDFRLMAVELAGGATFFDVPLGFTAGDMALAGDVLLVRGRHGAVEAYDALTGRPRYSVPLLDMKVRLEVTAFPEFGIGLACGADDESRRHVLAFDLQDGRRLWDKEDPSPALGTAWFQRCGDALAQFRAQGNGSRPDDVHAVLFLEPRTGRVLLENDRAGVLSTFDSGALTTDDSFFLIDVEEGPRRTQEHHLVRFGIDGTIERFPFGELPPAMLRNQYGYSVFRAGARGLAGTIDVKLRRIGARQPTVVFAFDAERGELRTVRLPDRAEDETGNSAASTVATPRALFVLREGLLHVFPAGGR